MNSSTLEDFIRDHRIIEELLRPRCKLIMVIGRSDTGKTTLVEHLAGFLSQHTQLGIVDSDMGQSHIGPPTTIAWGRIKGVFKGWSEVEAEDFYFTGTTTPFGSLLPAVVGTRLIAGRALSSCRKVIVDTTGLVSGPAGRALKQFKIDAVSPDMILALEISHELDHILKAFQSGKRPKVRRIPVPAGVGVKSTPVRSRRRFDLIASYLRGAGTLEVPYEYAALRFMREPRGHDIAEIKNRVISFRDEGNKDIALGVIDTLKLKEGKFLIRTPMRGDVKFSALVIGNAEIDWGNSLLRERKRAHPIRCISL
ncbi:MAG TPA: Clp1/GlmU family protein [Dissulfurispiraceae bacterium]